MLASKRFRVASNQADFLKLVVERNMLGKKTTEEIIGRALFPKFNKDESTDVRVTARNLRKSLATYYTKEGHADPVIISLPEPPADKSLKLLPGEAYTPVFTFNPRHEVEWLYATGENCLRRGHVFYLGEAFHEFIEVLFLDHFHAGARIGMAEILCEFVPPIRRELRPAYLNRLTFLPMDDRDRVRYLHLADVATDAALRLAPEYWRSHAARGFYFHSRGDNALAEDEFKAALKLDSVSTREYAWYIDYLIDLGKKTEALEAARSFATNHIENATAFAFYAACVYDTDFVEAEKAYEHACKLDNDFWLPHAAHSIIHGLFSEEEKNVESYRLTEVATQDIERLVSLPKRLVPKE